MEPKDTDQAVRWTLFVLLIPVLLVFVTLISIRPVLAGYGAIESIERPTKLVELVRYTVLKLPADYQRAQKPYTAHIRLYFQFRNNSDKTIIALLYAAMFVDNLGNVLHEQEYGHVLRIDPRKESAKQGFWFLEDNVYDNDEVYDKLQRYVDDGTLTIRVEIKKGVFADGMIVVF